MLRHVAVVPSTPLVLPGWPGRPHPDVGDVAAQAARAVDGVADGVDVVVVLAGGDRAAVVADLSDPAALDLRGYGADLPPHALAVPPPDAVRRVVAAVEDVAGSAVDPRPTPRASGRAAEGGDVDVPRPSADLVVLARLLPAGTPAVGVVVPPGLPAAEAERLAASLLGLASARGVALVIAGDLGAGFGPKPPRPGAAAASAALQDLIVAALDAGDPRALVRLDPDLVADAASRAAGALRVLGAVLAGARIGTVVRTATAPLGVGYVVARGG